MPLNLSFLFLSYKLSGVTALNTKKSKLWWHSVQSKVLLPVLLCDMAGDVIRAPQWNNSDSERNDYDCVSDRQWWYEYTLSEDDKTGIHGGLDGCWYCSGCKLWISSSSSVCRALSQCVRWLRLWNTALLCCLYEHSSVHNDNGLTVSSCPYLASGGTKKSAGLNVLTCLFHA